VQISTLIKFPVAGQQKVFYTPFQVTKGEIDKK
jgi:hypothetical protein